MVGATADVLSVGQVSAYIKELFDYDELLTDIWVTGEISNLSRSTAGHTYFTLKDAQGQLRCVLFKRAAAPGMSGALQHGESVLAHGRITIYEVSGDLQLYVDFVQGQGSGQLHQQFEELKGQLSSEGLFDASRKKPLPRFPSRIGVVTSPTGAALQDVLRVLASRYPSVEVIVSPCLVQGDSAPAAIAEALRAIDASNTVDVILLVRGGGSLEELWAFNTLIVARALALCTTPVVTGVGHETDTTIVDFISDQRMPTPSAAAAASVPDRMELLGAVAGAKYTLLASMRQTLSRLTIDLGTAQRELTRLAPRSLIATRRQRVDTLLATIQTLFRTRLSFQRSILLANSDRLHLLNPATILDRGYAIVSDQSGAIVSDPVHVHSGDRLHIRLARGTIGARVEPNTVE